MGQECRMNLSTQTIPPRLNKIINSMIKSGMDISKQKIIRLNGHRPEDIQIDLLKDPGIELCRGVFKKKLDTNYLIYSSVCMGIETHIYGILLSQDMETRVAILDVQSKCFLNREL